MPPEPTLSTTSHPRLSIEGRLIYPVLSRRSKGVSIGINLNPDRICNFGCVYCQVDRVEELPSPNVSQDLVLLQLHEILQQIHQQNGMWNGTPVTDIAFSGDGESTTYHAFPELLQKIITLRNSLGLQQLPIVLITNASRLHAPKILECLPYFFQEGGQIWAKLDAGDEEHYQTIAQSKIPFERILKNLVLMGTHHFPLTLQSCFFQWKQAPFQKNMLDTYIETVLSLIAQGTQIQAIQAYTVARIPAKNNAQSYHVSAWSNDVMDNIVSTLQETLQLKVEGFYKR